MGVSKDTNGSNVPDSRESGFYLLCMVCGGSGRSNESTTDTLRNQGTKSQGRVLDVLEESELQHFSVN